MKSDSRMHPSPGSVTGEEVPSGLVEFTVDDAVVRTLEGRTVAGALHAAGIRTWRRNMVTNEKRGPFCGMGVCFECELTVDETPGMRACLVPVHPGMRVRTQAGEAMIEAQR